MVQLAPPLTMARPSSTRSSGARAVLTEAENHPDARGDLTSSPCGPTGERHLRHGIRPAVLREVVIVGGGFTGPGTAYYLLRGTPGVDVLVLEVDHAMVSR